MRYTLFHVKHEEARRSGAPRGRVSRETRRAIAAALLLSLGAFAAACASPPSPKGWAAPQPITVESEQLVLASRRAHLYAFDRDGRLQWEFPPRDRDTYPLSQAGRDILTSILLDLDPSDDDATALQGAIDRTSVSGPSVDTLKDEIERSGLSDDGKDRLIDAVDEVADTEEDALKDLRAFYGDMGASDDGSLVYVTSFKGIVFGLQTTTGEMEWLVDAGNEVIGGVSVIGDTVYFGSKDQRVHALGAESGEELWSASVDGEVWATPGIGDGVIYVPTMEGSVYALDADDGSERWVFRGGEAGMAGRPTVDGDTVYVGGFDKKLYALSAEDGTERWTASADNWFWASPVVRDGIVYAASLDGTVYAMDADSGERRWDFDTGAPVRSTPVIAADGLVVAARNGDVFKLDLESGEATEGSPAVIGDTVEADLTADDEDIVYVMPTTDTLYLVNAAQRLSVGTVPLPD